MNKKIKIVALQGSFRPMSLTTAMLKYAVRKAEEAGYEVTYINLFEKNIGYCKGCRTCLKTAECVYKNDDMAEITEQIKACDVIILSSPTYWANVSAPVKNLFDRLSGTAMEETETFPKPRFGGKKYIFFGACSTPMPFARWAGQTKGLLRAVREFFKTSGVKCIGTVFCTNTGKKPEVNLKEYRKIDRLIEMI